MAEETEVIEQDTAADEASAFASDEDMDLEDGTEGLEEKPEAKLPESKEDDSGEEGLKDEKAEKDEKADEDDSEDVDEDEGDEDIARGKEILEAEEKEKAEKEAEDSQIKEQREQAGSYNPTSQGWDEKTIKFFTTVLPKDLLPKQVKLDDGSMLDFETIIEETPELPVMITAITKNIVDQMVYNGYLPSRKDVEAINQGVDKRLFMRTLTNEHSGVPEAQEIYQSEEFKTWFKDQPEAVKALMKSDKAKDHVRVFKRFLNQSGIDKAKGKVAEIDEKRKKSKKNYDSIHKTTVRSKRGAPKSVVDSRAEEMEGFNSKDDDDDFFS